jgi:uncharacterized membrane protein YqaE (UPF0057 family)
VIQIVCALSLPFIVAMLIFGSPQEDGWVMILMSVAAILASLFIPRQRIDVHSLGFDLYEDLWWKTTVHHFRHNQPPPKMIVERDDPPEGPSYDCLKIILHDGRKVSLGRASKLLSLQTTLLHPWNRTVP